jgi:uncharacterized membrane protein
MRWSGRSGDVTGDDQPRRSVYAYIAAPTLLAGSVLYFAQDEAAWVRPVRLVLLFAAIAAFTVEGWHVQEQRRSARQDGPPRQLWRLGGLIMSWLLLGIAVGEAFDLPVDLARVAVRLALACLMTAFFVWLYARLEKRR